MTDKNKLYNKLYNKMVRLFIVGIVLSVAGCSSLSGKGPVEVRTARSLAETHLDAANKQLDRGNYTRALQILEEGRRIAVAVDDPELLVQTSLAYGNIYYYLGREGEAELFWNDALQRAGEAGNEELSALCKIALARYKLLSKPDDKASASEVRNEIQNALAALKKDSLNAAEGLTVAALAEKELKNWAVAEADLKQAIAIHTRKNSLELAAYDWYLLASVYSTQKLFAQAADAAQTAVVLDRRAENSHGLGSDYLALGDIYTKAGELSKAAAMYRRALAIFNAARLESEATEAALRLKTAAGE